MAPPKNARSSLRGRILRRGPLGLALAALSGLVLGHLVGASLLYELPEFLLPVFVSFSGLLAAGVAYAARLGISRQELGSPQRFSFRRVCLMWLAAVALLVALEAAFTEGVWVYTEEDTEETREEKTVENRENEMEEVRVVTGRGSRSAEACVDGYGFGALDTCWSHRRLVKAAIALSYLATLVVTGALLGLGTAPPPLCILVMISTPKDYNELDQAEREWRGLYGALQLLVGQGKVGLERIPPTVDALQSRLRTGKTVHVLHFVGHGGFDAAAGGGFLILEDEKREGQKVGGEAFADLLKNQGALRLVVLNACNGASFRGDNALAGTAQSLIAHRRVPAVVAMRSEISDETARRFAECFYRAFADQLPIDACIGEARRALAAENNPEWGTPVLYLRAADGHPLAGAAADGAAEV